MMTRKDLAKKIAKKFRLSIAESDRIVKYSFDEIKKELQFRKRRVEFRGFGTFHTIGLSARVYQHPKTRKVVSIPASKRAVFRQSKNFFPKRKK